MSDLITEERVTELLRKASQNLNRLPPQSQPVAAAALAALSTPESVKHLTTLGEWGTVKALSWFAVVNPFAKVGDRDELPPDEPIGEASRAAGIAMLQGASVELVRIANERKAAQEALRRVVLEVGAAAVKALLPLLIAYMRSS